MAKFDWSKVDMEALAEKIKESIDKDQEDRKQFIDSGRFQEVLDRILLHMETNSQIGDNVYQEPLLEAVGEYRAITNEELIKTISIVIDQNRDAAFRDDDNPFENENVLAHGKKFGVMHGQGSFYYCRHPKRISEDTTLEG